jgi:apolipoprotein N-acyltransferase
MGLGRALALTTLSGVFYGLAFPPLGWWPLAWVALVPFLVAIAGADPRRAIGLGLWLGIAASYAVGTWMPAAVVTYYEQSVAIGALMFVACALWQAAWQYALFACVVRGFAAAPFGAATPLVMGAAWIAAEVARIVIPFGNPWASLGYAATATPIAVQIADLAGVAGVGFVVATVNAAIALWWTARRAGAAHAATPATASRGLAVAGLLVTATVAYGAFRLRGEAASAPGDPAALPVVAAQANLDLGTQWKSEFYGANVAAYSELTMKAVRTAPAALVVWPESALTFFLESEPTYAAYLGRLAAEVHAPLLTGGPRVIPRGGGREEFRNAAFLVAPSGETTLVYEKGRLVPFAEYFPLAGMTLLRRQFGKVREFTPGTLQAPFATPLGPAGMMICNEAMLGAEAADRVRRGAAWLVTLTNDSWVGRRHYAEIALAMVRLRAVEVRRWLVRASTSGPSAMIDPAGRIVDVLPFDRQGVVRADLVPRHDLTLYARVGDAFAWTCVAVTLAAAFAGRGHRRR